MHTIVHITTLSLILQCTEAIYNKEEEKEINEELKKKKDTTSRICV